MTLAAVLLTARSAPSSAQAPTAGAGEPATSSEQSQRYVVQPGDACERVAARVYGDARQCYTLIVPANPSIAPNPNVLTPGSVLTLPGVTPSPDARVTTIVHKVEARKPQVTQWEPAKQGLGLYRGWRVLTLDSSSAELTFRNESTIQMRENTLVIIYGETYGQTRRRTGAATLERGTLESHLGELRMQVETPSARANLLGGSSVLDVDTVGTSLVSSHTGATELASKAGGEVLVRPGFGASVRQGEPPTPPRPLPAPPDWVAGIPTRFAGLTRTGGTVHARWSAVPEAKLYHVELSRDPEGRSPVAAVRVPSDVLEMTARHLPAGTYFARVSAIDADGFESPAAEALPLTVALATVTGVGPAPAATPSVLATAGSPTATTPAAPGGADAAAGPVAVFVGASLRAPEGMRCGRMRAGQLEQPAELTRLDRTGVWNIACTGAGGPTAPVAVAVEHARIDVQPAPTLVRGRRETLHLALQAAIALPADVRVLPPPGARLDKVERTGPNALVVEITAGPNTPDSVDLRLVAGAPPDTATLGLATLHVVDAPAPQP
ncbi:MAG: tail protein X [Myxococcales bacterium]|nr:tail protein X [Myxococcales bacterium]